MGWRAVKVTERRTAVDFAEVVRWLVEEVHEEAEKVVLVMDNLNTHKLASLYEAFPPEQARRIAEKLEIHHTPKHGSWLNMAEIELSVLARQCLDRRIESAEDWARSGGMGGGTKRKDGDGGLAIHHGRRTDQAPQAIPDNSIVVDYYFLAPPRCG